MSKRGWEDDSAGGAGRKKPSYDASGANSGSSAGGYYGGAATSYSAPAAAYGGGSYGMQAPTFGGGGAVHVDGWSSSVAAQPPAPPAPAGASKKKGKDKDTAPAEPSGVLRSAGGEIWRDSQLASWDENDFRIFVGDLGSDCTDEVLAAAFRKYPSFQRGMCVKEKYNSRCKGYGFVSFKDPADFTKAMREMHGKYVGNRPVKLRKSTWKERNMENRDMDEAKRLRHLKNTKIAK